MKLDIIRKSKKIEKKAIFYEITERGLQMTDNYGKIRRNILERIISHKEYNFDWEKMASMIMEYKNIYDEASRLAVLLKTNDNPIK